MNYQELKELYNRNCHTYKAQSIVWNTESGKCNYIVDVEKYKNYVKGRSVLILGCGIGVQVWAYQQKGFDASGIDISEYAISNAVTDNCKCCDIKDMSYKDRQFDSVLGFDVLEHVSLDYIDDVIRHCERVTKFVFLAQIPYSKRYGEWAYNLEDKKRVLDITEIPVVVESESIPEDVLFFLQQHMINEPSEWCVQRFRVYFKEWVEWVERVEGTDWWLYKYERIVDD